MKTIFLILCLFSIAAIGQVQADFNIEANYCSNEIISIQNQSSEVHSYLWDFCLTDIDNTPSLEGGFFLTETNLPVSIRLVYDSANWYGFVSSRESNSLFRLDFGNSLSNDPTIHELGNIDGVFNGPRWLSFIKESDVWYALMLNGNGLLRLKFSNNLDGIPEVYNLGNFGLTNYPTGLDLVTESGNIYAIVSDFGSNKLISVNFGNSITNSPQVVTDLGSSSLVSGFYGIKLFKENNKWYAILASYTNGKVLLLHFENGLSSSPSFTEIASVTFPFHVEILFEGGIIYAMVNGRNSLLKLKFGESILETPEVTELGNLGSLSDIEGFTMVKDMNRWYGFTINFFSKELFKLEFPEECNDGASLLYSDKEIPFDLSYDSPGQKFIELLAMDIYGNRDRHKDSFGVLPQTAPSISFTTDNLCNISSGKFTPESDETLASYAWDFNNDGVEDSNEEIPSHQFPAIGTYTVRLDVDDGICQNLAVEEITIYEEPPLPDFESVGLLCGTNEISFNNLTNDATYAGPVEYTWNFDEIGTSNDRNASFNFGSAGNKTVTLTSSIPGCENQVQNQYNLLPGPNTQFSAGSVCATEELVFSNTSTDADTYRWDFGDGFTNTNENPIHIYANGGLYTVTLTSEDTKGCTHTLEKEVSIPHVPDPMFSFDTPCSSSAGIQFSDESVVSTADVVAWNWYLDGEEASTEQHPLINFDKTGDRAIRLEVTSSNGCSSSLEETVEILAGLNPEFSTGLSCQAIPIKFTDQTPSQELIVSRFWDVNGVIYTGTEIQHTFQTVGEYDVTLTVTAENFCTGTVSNRVEIMEAPNVDFFLSSMCIENPIELTDVTTSDDPIVSRNWLLNGETFFNGETALLSDISSGEYEIALEVSTSLGCTFSETKEIEIIEAPDVQIESRSLYGAPPLSIDFTSNSSEGHSWFIDENLESSSNTFSYTFEEEGSYDVRLNVSDGKGCVVSRETTVLVRTPEVDLVVNNIILNETSAGQQVTLNVFNRSNLPVEIFDVVITSGEDFAISERFNQFINFGTQASVTLSSSLQIKNGQSVCANLTSGFGDLNPDDNEICVSFISEPILEEPAPNPIADELSVRIILNELTPARLQISDISGHLFVSEELNELREGLNVFSYFTGQWETGMYFITLIQGNHQITRKAIKKN